MRYVVIFNPGNINFYENAKEIIGYNVDKVSQKNKLKTIFSNDKITIYSSIDLGNSVNGTSGFSFGTGQAVFFGSVFKRILRESNDGNYIEQKINEKDYNEIIHSSGDVLSNKYWGTYIAFILNENRVLSIYRDPSGSLPCYYTFVNGIYVFFSNISDIMPILERPPVINENFVNAQLTIGLVNNNSTGLNNIYKILSGQRIRIVNGQLLEEIYWHPLPFIKNNITKNESEASILLKNEVMSAVKSYTNGHRKISIRLSGGLDSNILLACSRKADPDADILALHHQFNDPAADEYLFAKQGAENCNAIIENISHQFEDFHLDLYDDYPHEPEPISDWYSLTVRNKELTPYLKHGSTLLLAGNGGDEVFFATYSEWPAEDYIRENGINSNFFKIILESAQISGLSFYEVAKRSLRNGLIYRKKNSERIIRAADFPLLNTELLSVEEHKKTLHPWLSDLEDVPYGKWFQAYCMSVPNYRRTIQHGEFCINHATPLYTQPIFEAVLGIPSHILALNGRDRGLARSTFSDIVPERIIWRDAKAIGDSFMRKLIFYHKTSLREFFLDGELARLGLINKVSIEKVINPSDIEFSSNICDLLVYANIEAWLRKWK